MSEKQLEIKEVILTVTPAKHKNDEEWWELHYSLEGWLRIHPNNSQYYASVTRKTCPEIENLKKGDKILVTIESQKVVKVAAVKRELRKNRVKIGGMVETDKSAEEWMDDFIDWIESRKEYFGGGARKEKRQ